MRVASLGVERLVVRRGGRTVLRDLALEVHAGEVVGVVGKNGGGKSTLLAAVAGVLPPHEGRITVAGASVWGTSRERSRARAALGYVPEGADAPGFLRGAELWALCAATRRAAPPAAAVREALGLDELGELVLERMSLGQRRRACLGAAFVGPPHLLVLDEPENGLDAARLAAMTDLVRAHAAGGGACIVASHDAALLSALGARIYALPPRADD